MIKLTHIEQQSEEWFHMRAGRPSASNFDKIITSTGKPSSQRAKYVYQLAGEALTGTKEATFQSRDMQNGIEREEEARQLFEMLHDVEVEQVGLCALDDKLEVLCSPDGLLPNQEGLEIKCPKMATHVEYLLKQKLPTTYFQQVQGSMYVTGYKAWWFMSYYPGTSDSPGLPPFIIKVERDEDFISKFAPLVAETVKETQEVINKIKGEN